MYYQRCSQLRNRLGTSSPIAMFGLLQLTNITWLLVLVHKNGNYVLTTSLLNLVIEKSVSGSFI